MTQPTTPYIHTGLLDAVETQIKEIETDFQRNKALILTEDDLQCHLFRKLLDIFPAGGDTKDNGVTGCAVHSEVKFYDRQNKLSLIPDLCLIPPHELSIYGALNYSMTRRGPRRGPLPSKGFQFGGDALIIELKYCRKKVGIQEKDIQKYAADLNKIRGLRDLRARRTNGEHHLLGILAIFNKTNNGHELVEAFIRQNREEAIRILYCTGAVDFNNYDPRHPGIR
jgi:hypothetical protein